MRGAVSALTPVLDEGLELARHTHHWDPKTPLAVSRKAAPLEDPTSSLLHLIDFAELNVTATLDAGSSGTGKT